MARRWTNAGSLKSAGTSRRMSSVVLYGASVSALAGRPVDDGLVHLSDLEDHSQCRPFSSSLLSHASALASVETRVMATSSSCPSVSAFGAGASRREYNSG